MSALDVEVNLVENLLLNLRQKAGGTPAATAGLTTGSKSGVGLGRGGGGHS